MYYEKFSLRFKSLKGDIIRKKKIDDLLDHRSIQNLKKKVDLKFFHFKYYLLFSKISIKIIYRKLYLDTNIIVFAQFVE